MNKLLVKRKLAIMVLFTCFFLAQGCSTSQYSNTSNQIRVNQDLANAWRKHGDEKTARSFEQRNEEIIRKETDNYGIGDFIIDLFFK